MHLYYSQATFIFESDLSFFFLNFRFPRNNAVSLLDRLTIITADSQRRSGTWKTTPGRTPAPAARSGRHCDISETTLFRIWPSPQGVAMHSFASQKV